jgi:predicted enzyme related to lactoylglutathione lyase
MIPIRDLFEAHLTVTDLQRSMRFFGDALGWNWRRSSRKERLRSTGYGVEEIACSGYGKQGRGRNE